MRGDVTDAGQTTNKEEEELKIELLSQWKLEAEFRNFVNYDEEEEYAQGGPPRTKIRK